MTHKIDGFGQQPVGVGSGRRSEPVRAVDPASAPRQAATAQDQVTLTGASRQLQQLAAAVAAAPEVDARRVEALRALIERGRYELDARRIADRILDFERELAVR
jgi:negative regulator of flagellin synthesis FlgM